MTAKLDKNPDTIVPAQKLVVDNLEQQLQEKEKSNANAIAVENPKEPAPLESKKQESTHSEDESDSIFFKTKDGGMIELTPHKLDQMLSNTEKDSEQKNLETKIPDQAKITEILSLYGLQSSKDVIKFLKSPAGETVKKMIQEKIEEIAAQEDIRQQQMLEDQNKHNRMLAFFLLGLMHKHDAKAHRLHEAIQHQIDLKLHKSPEESDKASQAALERRLESLDASYKALDKVLAEKTKEQDALKLELAALEKQGKNLEQRAQIFDKRMARMDEFSKNHSLESEETPKKILDEIDVLNEKIASRSKKISGLLDTKEGAEAQRHKHKLEALHLHKDELHNMLAAARKERVLYNAAGEKTDHFHHAAFILKPDQKVVVKDNVHYLIGAHQNLDDPAVNKEKAKTHFNKLAPEICCAKNLIKHQCKMENEKNGQRIEAVHARSRGLQAEVIVLTNQMLQVQAAHANVRNELKQVNPDINKAEALQRSVSTTAGTAPVNKPSPNVSRQAIEQVKTLLTQSIDQMVRNPSHQNVSALRTNFTNIYGQNTNVQSVMGQIRPGFPIPPSQVVFLMKYVHSLPLLPDSQKLADRLEPQEPSYAKPEHDSPTPFSTTPSPFK